MVLSSPTLRASWLVCVGMLACHGAWAQVSGSLALSGIHYVLTDLDPDDGITPELTWTSSGDLSNLLDIDEQRAPWVFPGGTPNFVNVFHKEETDSGLDAASTLAQGAFASSVSQDGVRLTYEMPLGKWVNANATYTRNFQLTPHTLVSFHGDLDGTLASQVPSWAPNPNGYFDWAYVQINSSAGLSAWRDTAPQELAQTANASQGLGQRTSVPGTDSSQIIDTRLTVTLANSKDAALAGKVMFSAQVNGYTVVPTIPEAGTWAQMALGGGLLWALQRRRRPSGQDLSARTLG